MYKRIFSLLLLTSNEPLQIGKCTPRGGGWWSTVDTFLHFQPLLLCFMSKQAQNLSHTKFITQVTLYTQYHAKT